MRSTVWIRRLALAAGALLLLFAVAAAVLVATFDANRYKGLAVDWVRAEYQRNLVIDGSIELSVLPRLAVKVSKLRLSERARPEEFAAIDEAALALQWWPLLSQRLVVDRVSARGVRAVYSRNAQGASNIDDLLKPRGASATAAPATDKQPRFGVDISSITLENLQLRLRDDLAKRAGQIDVQRFKSGRLANGVETPLELQASVKLTQPQPLQVALDARGNVALTFQSMAVAARDLKLKLEGDAAGLQGLVVQLAAKGLVHDPAARRLRLDALTLSLDGRANGQPLEAALDWPRLTVDGDRLEGSALTGRIKRGGPNALSATFRSEAPSGSFEALRLPGFALAFNGSAAPRKFEGKARTDLLLRPPQGAYALERVDLSATLEQAGAAALALSLRGQAAGDAKAAQWALDGALAGNRFESKGSAVLGGNVPAIRATARFDSLDLNKLVGTATETAASKPGAAADERVVLEALRSVNGRLELAANSLAYRQYRFNDARVEALLDNGVLRIPRLAARAWGGNLEGSGSADARSQRIGVKLAATGVDVNALLKDVAGKDLLEGRGRVQADLTTSGATLGALRSNLAGSAALQLRDGAIKGINLARTMRQAKAALSGRQDALTRARETEKTDFSELNMTARIAEGVAHSDDLDVKSPFLRIGGAGKFDVGRGRIDYVARATVVGAPAGQDAGELAALRGVTVPVLLSGPFEAIDWNIQWSGVAAAALENKLKDKLAEKLGAKLGLTPAPAGSASAPSAAAPKDQLKERLKGLFK